MTPPSLVLLVCPPPFCALGLRPFLRQNQPRKRVQLRPAADQGHLPSQASRPRWGGAPPGPSGPQRPRHTLPRACQLGPNLISALSVRTPLNPIPLITAASLLAARPPPVRPESPQTLLRKPDWELRPGIPWTPLTGQSPAAAWVVPDWGISMFLSISGPGASSHALGCVILSEAPTLSELLWELGRTGPPRRGRLKPKSPAKPPRGRPARRGEPGQAVQRTGAAKSTLQN